MKYLIVFVSAFFLQQQALATATPLEIAQNLEGSYLGQDEESPDNEYMISLMYSDRTQSLLLTVSTHPNGRILFFASKVHDHTSVGGNTGGNNGGGSSLNPSNGSQINIEADGLDFRGRAQTMDFTFDLANQSVQGEVRANFFNGTEPLKLSGNKMAETFSSLDASQAVQCDENELHGTFEGLFNGRPAKISVQKIDGEWSANLETTTSNFYYHHGVIDPGLKHFSLINDIAYSAMGRAKKLIFTCHMENGRTQLRGLSMASNGRILRDMVFTKPLE